jgi:hypothetical protein
VDPKWLVELAPKFYKQGAWFGVVWLGGVGEGVLVVGWFGWVVGGLVGEEVSVFGS